MVERPLLPFKTSRNYVVTSPSRFEFCYVLSTVAYNFKLSTRGINPEILVREGTVRYLDHGARDQNESMMLMGETKHMNAKPMQNGTLTSSFCFALIFLSTSIANRELQNIVILDPFGQRTASGPNIELTDLPQSIVVCQNVDTEALSYQTEVTVHYTVETDVEEESAPEGFFDEDIPKIVARSAVNMTADEMCATNCVISVSTGSPGTLLGPCEKNLNESLSCHQYTDVFTVLHTDQCTHENILTGADLAISDTLTSGDFLDFINQFVDGAEVTLVTYLGGGEYIPATSSIMMSNGGLTAAGKFFVFLMVVAALTVVVIFAAWRRHVAYRRRLLEDDLKSIRTDWSRTTGDDCSYLQPDFHDLALRHSKQNVHRCQSALCTVCRPHLGVVHMLQVPRGTANIGDTDLEEFQDLPENNGHNGSFQVCGTVKNMGDSLGSVSEDEVYSSQSPNRPRRSSRQRLPDLEYVDEGGFILETGSDRKKKRGRFGRIGRNDDEEDDEGYTFVRVANAKRVDTEEMPHNCYGEPSKEVIL